MPRLSTKVVKSDKPRALFIEMPEDQRERFRQLAESLGMSMRELVTFALERLAAETEPPVEVNRNVLADEPGVYQIQRDIHQPLAGDDGRPQAPSVNIAALANMTVQTARRVGLLERRLADMFDKPTQLALPKKGTKR